MKRAGLHGIKPPESARHSLARGGFFIVGFVPKLKEGDLRLGVFSSYSSSRADVLDFPCPVARWGVVSGLFLRVVLHHHAADGRAAAERRADLIQGWCGTCRHFADISALGTPPELGYGASRDDLKQRDPRPTKKKVNTLSAAENRTMRETRCTGWCWIIKLGTGCGSRYGTRRHARRRDARHLGYMAPPPAFPIRSPALTFRPNDAGWPVV